MAFKGTLKEFKVPDILQLISLQRKTGILTFTSGDGFITLIFDQGLIVGVDSFPKKLETRVGNVLVKQDFISEEMLQRALTIQKRTNQKIGEILIGMGMIGEETINESLKTQAVEVILSLFRWKKGEYNLKVMDHLDRSMHMIEPIPTDNLIMEGVQMLDEWPLHKKLVPDENMVFQPVQVETRDIEIIDEYDEEQHAIDEEKIYLNETEASLLKYINGQHSVRDLVEMGVFTEYKVYKSLFSLIKKNIIKIKHKTEPDIIKEERLLADLKAASGKTVNRFCNAVLIILLLIFIFTFFKPLTPFKQGKVLLNTGLYETLVNQEKE
ncbi:MAG: DUF4388 domain-containing protein [Candidatus Aminicenantes bacterium]|nr:DUF4388 domain-containing protein [Candidatus Aminicenantes bacterium]